MENRQIREGAGLEESRLNVEFIEFLKKWSGPVLMVLAVIAGGYLLMNYQRQRARDAVDRAFLAYEAAANSGSPEGLIAVAREHPSARAVPFMARLAAADILLSSANRGVAPGALMNPDGTPVEATDLLDEDTRTAQYERARGLYQAVLDDSERDPDDAIHAISAFYGLAAVAESLGDFDKAAEVYDRVIEFAPTVGFVEEVDRATALKDTLADISSKTLVLYERSQLASPPPAVAPTGLPAGFTPVDAPPLGPVEDVGAEPLGPFAPPPGEETPAEPASDEPEAGPSGEQPGTSEPAPAEPESPDRR